MNPYNILAARKRDYLNGKITDKELFGPLFQQLSEHYTQTITGRADIKVSILQDKNDETVGYTVKDRIVVNAGSDLVTAYKSQETRFKSALGILFHECGHIIDAALLREYVNVLEQMHQGKCLINPDTMSAEEAEVLDAIADIKTRPVIVQMCQNIMNIGLDAHDEAYLTRNYNALIGHCLNVTLEAMRAQNLTLQQMRQKTEMSGIDIMMSLLFQMVRYGDVLSETDPYKEPEMKLICQHAASIEVLRTSDNAKERNSAAWELLVMLWEFIKDNLPQQAPQQGSNPHQGNPQQGNPQQGTPQQGTPQQGTPQQGTPQQGTPQQGTPQQGNPQQGNPQQGNPQQGNPQQGNNSQPMTEETIKKIMESLAKAAEGCSTKTPENIVSGLKQSDKGGKDAGCLGERLSQQLLKQLKDSMTEEKATADVERSVVSGDNAVIQTCDKSSAHRGISVNTVNAKLPPSENAITSYNEKFADVKPWIKRLCKEMKAMFEELREGEVSRGRSYGRLDKKGLTRVTTDNRIFCRKTEPRDIPDMAVAVLIDQSGSMDGPRIAACEKAAIILEAFTSELGIPSMLCGHNTKNGFSFYIHKNFDTVDKRKKYNLSEIPVGGCNRDGLAIQIASEMLGKRDEEDKILIIISDGQPNDRGYGGEEAAKDIRKIVNAAYRKYGIVSFAAAIGADKDRIRGIYGRQFIDIEDLSKLPKALTQILRERLEEN